MPQTDRVIFHADMNAYFASVEELFHPELREVPMAVCGDPEARRGIIVAKNEKAKAFGIKTAEPIQQALRKCPSLVLRRTRHNAYGVFCEKANAIYGQYTDLVEKASIDESYMDVTGTVHLFGGDAEKLAHEIRTRIFRELGLTVSVGVSFNKFFAKMASDMRKPNAVTVLNRDNYRDKLWTLPIGEMHMVGKAAETVLAGMGIETIGDLAQTDPLWLSAKLGRHGESLHDNANGLDVSPVVPPEATPAAKSIGKHNTFRRDLTERDEFRTALIALSDTVASSLRKENVKCLSVQLTIKDANFKVITRQKGFSKPTWLASEIMEACLELIDTHWKEGKPVRLLAVTAMKLVPKDAVIEQVTLFDALGDRANRDRRERLELAMDSIRKRFGEDSIATASVTMSDIGIGRRDTMPTEEEEDLD